jgi:Skp family chaperone for outer membrane proteins
MNKFVFGAASVVLATLIPAAAPAQKLNPPVVAVVDTQRVFRDCNACKTAQTTLQQQLDALRGRAQQLGQPLQTEEQSLQTAVQALQGKAPDAALQQRIQAFQTRQNTAAQELQTGQQRIERNRQYVAQQINAKLEPIFNQVMQIRGANLLIDEGATLAHGSTLDVTNDVLSMLNQQLQTINTNAPAAAPAAAPAQQQQQPQGR